MNINNIDKLGFKVFFDTLQNKRRVAIIETSQKNIFKILTRLSKKQPNTINLSSSHELGTVLMSTDNIIVFLNLYETLHELKEEV